MNNSVVNCTFLAISTRNRHQKITLHTFHFFLLVPTNLFVQTIDINESHPLWQAWCLLLLSLRGLEYSMHDLLLLDQESTHNPVKVRGGRRDKKENMSWFQCVATEQWRSYNSFHHSHFMKDSKTYQCLVLYFLEWSSFGRKSFTTWNVLITFLWVSPHPATFRNLGLYSILGIVSVFYVTFSS